MELVDVLFKKVVSRGIYEETDFLALEQNYVDVLNEFKKLFSFIGNRQSDEIGMPHLDSKCVYAHLAKMGAPIHTPHSELWFLPDKDL